MSTSARRWSTGGNAESDGAELAAGQPVTMPER